MEILKWLTELSAVLDMQGSTNTRKLKLQCLKWA
jgi:hypothetical protein